MATRSAMFASHKIPMVPEDACVFDEENPYSLQNLATPEVRAAIEALPIKFYKYSEFRLREHANPCPEIARLRISFWDEYLRAADEKRKMNMRSVTAGVCSMRYFYETVLKNENWVGYITIPPIDYQLALRELLELSWERLREVLLMPLKEKVNIKKTSTDPDTGKQITTFEVVEKPNTSLISEIRQITNMLDLRIKGAVVQRMQIEQKNLNMNMDVESSGNFLADATMAQLEEMEKRVNALRGSMQEVEKLDAATIESSETEERSNPAEKAVGPSTEED